MSTREDFFQNADFQAKVGAQQERYENTVVRTILNWAKLNAAVMDRELRQLDPDHGGFTLAWFREQFPLFPISLGCQKIAYVYQMDLITDMFHRPTTTRLVKAYNEWLTADYHDPTKENVGFVFELTGSGMGTQVLHNWPRTFETIAEGKMGKNYVLGRYLGSPPVFHYLEPLRALLEAAGTEWAIADDQV